MHTVRRATNTSIQLCKKWSNECVTSAPPLGGSLLAAARHMTGWKPEGASSLDRARVLAPWAMRWLWLRSSVLK